MSKEPHVRAALDEEEQALIDAVEEGAFTSVMTPQMREDARAAAHQTMNEGSVKVSLRMSKTDLARVKARALREGVPYQTLIKSIIHQAVSR